jgi:hypothetical protein
MSDARPSLDRPPQGASRLACRPAAAKLGALWVMLFALLGAVAACGGNPDVAVSRGRSLELHVSTPDIVNEVNFIDGAGNPRQIRARASNRQLAVVEVTVVNRTSIVTPLRIDSESAQLGDRRGQRIDALDPFESGRPIAELSEDDQTYAGFLWGDTQLEREFQITGWMVFDVPRGLTLGTFWWREVDQISVNLFL